MNGRDALARLCSSQTTESARSFGIRADQPLPRPRSPDAHPMFRITAGGRFAAAKIFVLVRYIVLENAKNSTHYCIFNYLAAFANGRTIVVRSMRGTGRDADGRPQGDDPLRPWTEGIFARKRELPIDKNHRPAATTVSSVIGIRRATRTMRHPPLPVMRGDRREGVRDRTTGGRRRRHRPEDGLGRPAHASIPKGNRAGAGARRYRPSDGYAGAPYPRTPHGGFPGTAGS